MLCDTCRFMVFKRPKAIGLDHVLDPNGQPRDDFLYFVHSKHNAQFKDSAMRCHFCRKMKVGLEGEKGPIPFGNYIILRIFVPKTLDQEYLSNDLGTRLQQDILYAYCGDVKTLADFDTRIAADAAELATMNSPVTAGREAEIEELRQQDHSTLSKLNLALAKRWLEVCNQTHELCKSIVSTPATLPNRVIDLTTSDRPYLTLGQGRREPYVTLSYKWGSARRYLATEDTITEFQKTVWSELLPKTFKDAIRVAISLKFRFLWIDALCIKQDSPAEVAAQIAVMGEIYSGSSLTLYAAAGDNTDVGLDFERDPIIQKPTSLNMRFETDNEVFEGLLYVQHFTNPYLARAHDPLFERAWVLQEELLSFRGLSFLKDEISWGCMYVNASESRPGMLSTSSAVDIEQADNFARLRFCMRDKNALANVRQYPETNRRVTVFDEWYKMVETYSKRELTFNIDIINAITGVSLVLRRVHSCTFVAGLCVEDMQLGLLWRAIDVLPWLTPLDQAASLTSTAVKYLSTKFFGSITKSKEAISGLSTVQSKARRYSIMVESFGGKVVPMGDTHEISTIKIIPPSWSWTSVFHSKAGIDFEHKRRYGRDEESGIQVIDFRFVELSIGADTDESNLTIAMRAQAPTRWAKVSPRHVNQDYFSLVNRSSEEYDPVYYTYLKYKAGETVARLYPDEDNIVIGGMEVLCVICANALWPSEDGLDTSTEFTGIAVVPAPRASQMFVRVGLVIAANTEWFRWPFKWEVLEMEII